MASNRGRTFGMARTRGFTLVELLVVIAIIGILVTLGLAVASRVASGGKQRATENLLKTLDQALSEYINAKEGKAPAYFKDERGVEFPMIDARAQSGTAVEPSLALFLAEATRVASVQAIITGLDPQFVESVDLVTANGLTPSLIRNALRTVTVKDAWGRPIRFVHPAFHGGYGPSSRAAGRAPRTFQVAGVDTVFVRVAEPAGGAAGDADEGLCVNNRPYFYSAGADGNPGTRDDNVYTTRPTFPAESTSRTNN